MGGLRRIAARPGLVRNFASLLGAEAVTRILGIVTFILVVRSAGAEPLGHLVFAQALIGYVSVVGDGGLSTYMQRQIAGRSERIPEQVSAATVTQLGIGTLLGVVIAAIALLLPLESERARLLLVLTPVLVAQALSLLYVLQALEDMVPVALIRIVIQVVVSGIAIPGVLLTNDIVWMAAATWIGLTVGNLACWVMLRRRHAFRLAPFTLDVIPTLVRHGLPFLGIALVTQLLLNLDVVVLGLIRDPAEVGEYGAAFRLIFLLFSVSGILATAVLPQLVWRFRDDIGRFTMLLETLVRLVARITLPVTALLVVESSRAVPQLLGPDFIASAPLVSVLSGWLPLGFYNTVLGIGLIAAGLQKRYFQAAAVAAVTSAAMLILLVPLYGSWGAAWTLIAREGVILALFTLVTMRLRLASPLRELLGQSHMFVVPVGALIALAWAWPGRPLAVSIGAWLLVVLALEAAARWPVLRELAGVRQPPP